MITVKKYVCSHQFRVYWNKYAGTDQYEFEKAECTSVYVFGMLIFKKLKSMEK